MSNANAISSIRRNPGMELHFKIRKSSVDSNSISIRVLHEYEGLDPRNSVLLELESQ